MLQVLHFDPVSSGGRKTPVHDTPGSAGFRMIDVADLHVLLSYSGKGYGKR